MLTVGNKLPSFNLQAVPQGEPQNPSEAFVEINDKSYEGKWLVLFAWPKDFTFVCPTEIAAFSALNDEFADRDTQILGLSTDSEFVHLAWKRDNEDLRDLKFPMLSDLKRELSTALGILVKEEGVCLRATLIVDTDVIIRPVYVIDIH